MTTALSFEQGSLIDGAIRAMARVIVAPFVAVFWLLAGLVAYWQPLALCAGIVGAVAACVVCPMLPVGLGIVALVGWVTYPRPRVSWNSRQGVGA